MHSSRRRRVPFFTIASVPGLIVSIGLTSASPKPDDAKLAPNDQKLTTVMIQMAGEPAAVTYAAAVQDSQARVDAARNYALSHPNLTSSRQLLEQKEMPVQITPAA